MPREEPARIARELASHGYAADREAVTLLASAENPETALVTAVEATPDDELKLSAADVRAALDRGGSRRTSVGGGTASGDGGAAQPSSDPFVSTGTPADEGDGSGGVAVETEGSGGGRLSVDNDMTGRSTGTGEYDDFVATFRDRYERLAGQLKGRVTHRSAEALAASAGGGDAAMIGMVDDVSSTTSGHWIVDLEDTTGVFPCLVMKDRPIAGVVEELLHDEVVAVEGSLSDDGSILFVDDIFFPNVPRTFEPSTADRPVRAALVSDVHVGSQEFRADAWSAFADWLHTPDAADVEYLLIAGDMVEGVGVYRDQDEELDVLDVYEQYEAFSELLKEVPGDVEIVMIPGNHDAVRGPP